MSGDERIRIGHMIEAAREALEFAGGKTRPDLENSRMMVMAVLKELEIVGEAATKISPATRMELPEIPWHDIIGMRHRLVHGYFDVDLDVVWQAIETELVPLIASLEAALAASE